MVSLSRHGSGARRFRAGPALKTPWGEPDLQGIWTEETDTPLQRPAKYADQEFFTEAQRAELDKARSAIVGKDKRAERGTELDVAGSYNDLFVPRKHTGARTSLIVDPPNGRIPPLTPEAQKTAAAEREFRLALLQSTETCKNEVPACAGGKYDPTPSPRRAETPPRYNTARMNRHDGPEDHRWEPLPDRRATRIRRQQGSFRRIVQTPGGIAIFYDVGQGQGWQRNIVMDGSPHLPANIRQWYGDSRGHWEGNTLVIDVTNFSPKTDYQGSRENLHLIERWTRTGPTYARIRGDRSKTRPCGRGRGPSSRSSPGKASREPDLLRAALHRRKLCLPGADARSPHGGTRFCRGTGSGPGDEGQRDRHLRGRRRSIGAVISAGGSGQPYGAPGATAAGSAASQILGKRNKSPGVLQCVPAA